MSAVSHSFPFYKLTWLVLHVTTTYNNCPWMASGYYSLKRWRCRTCDLVTMDLPEPPWELQLYRWGISYKKCRNCLSKSFLKLLRIRAQDIFNHSPFSSHTDSWHLLTPQLVYIIVYLCIVCICWLYFLNVSRPSDIKCPCRPALQKAQIPNNIQTQIVSFLVLSQKQASLRKYHFRILHGNWNNTSNSPFLQLMQRMSTAPPTKGRRDLLDYVISFLVIWCINNDWIQHDSTSIWYRLMMSDVSNNGTRPWLSIALIKKDQGHSRPFLYEHVWYVLIYFELVDWQDLHGLGMTWHFLRWHIAGWILTHNKSLLFVYICLLSFVNSNRL